nr:NPCBM/NEW2 domain-containing protein [Planctomycetota bacterium]
VVPPVGKIFSDMDAILDDMLAPAVDPEARMARMVTTHGAVLTYRADMLVPQKREKNRLYHAVQPAWSLDSISAAFDEIAVLGYRAHNEIPLSSFPATLLEKRSLIGFSPSWKRNKNVRGGILASGTMFADVGVGTHSYSKIAFAIPADIVTRFRGYVGIDRVAQGGGCVRVKVFRGITGGDAVEAYHSGHLIGINGHTPFDISDFTKCDRIVLETGFGDQGRPGGADPFDIRDDVSWIRTMLTINVTELRSRAWWGFQQSFPQLANWNIPDNFKSHVTMSAHWNATEGRWMSGLSWRAPVATTVDTPIMEFSRKVVLTLNNSWLTVSGASDGIGDKTATVRVTVNDEPIESIANANVNLAGSVGSFDTKHWTLGAMLGEEVEIKVQVMPREAGTYKPQGFTIGSFGLQPVITGVPGDGILPVPDVPITSLNPLSFSLPGYTELPPVGILKDEIPLQTDGVLITDGYVFPSEGVFVYKLLPNYDEFIMVIGRDQSKTQTFGPCEVLIDDEVVWTSKELFGVSDDSEQQKEELEGVFNDSTRSAYIRIPIPAGHASLTIRNRSQATHLGFIGSAGFNEK